MLNLCRRPWILLLLSLCSCESCIPKETDSYFLNGRVASSCSSQELCEGDLSCVALSQNGYCTAGCPQQQACPFGSTCQNVSELGGNYCMAPWMAYKTSGGVGTPCNDASQCDGCLECLSHGTDKQCTKSCNPTAPCPPGSHCGTEPFKSCAPESENLKAEGGLGDVCETDSDCQEGKRCVLFGHQRICSRSCQSGSECPDNWSCLDGELETVCLKDGDDELYFTGSDLGRQCNPNSPCPEGLNCVDFGEKSYCTRGCELSTLCPEGSQCNELPTTLETPETTPEGSQNPTTPLCLSTNGPIGSTCENENDCLLGLKCVNQIPGGFCTAECSATNPCPRELNAKCIKLSRGFGVVCLKPCTAQCDCREGTTCTRVGTSATFVCFPNL